ncbi:MAG: sulfite exporter TauE/SafE family protein [Erythrobacter sp.]|nr:sulfite exporter TauE/SafE family protein [Erythrobacter sp.]
MISEMFALISASPWEVVLPFIIIGLLAQLVDGTLGAGFGMVSHTLLSMLGLPATSATMATHSVESLTSGASGISHALQRNIDWYLFARLAVPGIVGGLIGVWLLTTINTALLQPFMLVYIGALGIFLIWRATMRAEGFRRARHVRSLALAGGVLDASGGGWGAIVAGSLVAQGISPRTAIGTTNAAEFFVTVTILAALAGSHGLEFVSLAAGGLLVGGLLASPFSAWLTRRIPSRVLARLVGILLLTLSMAGIFMLALRPAELFLRV